MTHAAVGPEISERRLKAKPLSAHNVHVTMEQVMVVSMQVPSSGVQKIEESSPQELAP